MSSSDDHNNKNIGVPSNSILNWNILLFILLLVLVFVVITALIFFILDATGVTLPSFLGIGSNVFVLSFQEIIIAITATTALFGFLSERQKSHDEMLYEQRQELKEKRLKNLENRLEWALREFPTFTYLLGRTVTAIREVRETYFYDLDAENIKQINNPRYNISLTNEERNFISGASDDEKNNLENEKIKSVYNLLFQFGKIRIMEETFRSEQGQIFRFLNHDKEMIAQFLFDLGVEGLGFHSNRMNRRMNFTIEQEMYLLEKTLECQIDEKMKGFYSMSQFLDIAKDDQIINNMANQLKSVIGNSRGGEWAEKNFDVLSRFLNQEIYRANEEIDRIYEDETEYGIPKLSYPDRQYIDAVRKISTIFVSLSSMRDEEEKLPLRIWVYNHWEKSIKLDNRLIEVKVLGENGFDLPLKLYNAEAVMKTITKLRRKLNASEDPIERNQSISYDALKKEIEPFQIKNELGSGETAIALWSRRDKHNNPIKFGNYRIVYLPREEDLVLGWTSAYAIDFIMQDRIKYFKEQEDKIIQIKIQDWRMRHSFN